MIKADLFHKRPYSLTIAISKKELTLKEEVDFRSQTNHYFYHNQGESGRLLTFSRYNGDGYGRVVYKSHTNQYYSQRGYIRGDGERHGSRSEDINHLYLFNVEENVDGIGRSGSWSRTRPSTSHNSGDHGRSSGFNSYGDNRSEHRYHTIQFSAYNNGGINIYHPRFPQ